MMISKLIHPLQRTSAATHVPGPHTGVGVIAFLVSLALLEPSRSYAQCDYEVTVIQPPPCPISGIPPTFSSGVSNLGHVVGWYWKCQSSDEVAFAWTPQSGLTNVPFAPGTTRQRPMDINIAGRIVGSFCPPNDGFGDLAFVYEDGKLTNLGTLPGGTFSEAVAVNDLGQVAGTAANTVTGVPPFTPFVWQDGTMTALALPFGPNAFARDINDNGQVVGWMGQSTGIDSHSYIWESGVVTDLGKAPGAFASDATAINNSGHVLVVGLVQEDETSPVLWDCYLLDDGQWIDLGHLQGFDKCAGLDVNDAAQVVGYCTKSAQPNSIEPFLWQGGVMTPLNDLFSDPAAIASGPTVAINQSGQIAVRGGYDGEQAAFLLTPINQTPGDVDYDCTVGIKDLLLLISTWGPCPGPTLPCLADVDSDGQVGVTDLLTVLSSWSF